MVGEEEARRLAQENGLIYAETTATDYESVSAVFENMVKIVLGKIERGEIDVEREYGVRRGMQKGVEKIIEREKNKNRGRCC